MDEDTTEWTDLGHGVSISYTRWGAHDPVGLVERHPHARTGQECGGGVLFDLDGVREAFADRAVWTIESLDPLTIMPSLLCRSCGHHGWITAGRWVPA